MARDSLPARPLPVLGAIAAATGIVGYVVFGWRFGQSDGTLPVVLGITFAAIAIGLTLYRRL